jgi:hypothetical protein
MLTHPNEALKQHSRIGRVGLDSYAYHRLLGEIRQGEEDTGELLPRGSLDVVAEARRLDVSFLSLETCFLPSPSEIDSALYRQEAGSVELGVRGAPAWARIWSK